MALDNGYLAEKYCWTQKVYLAVTFPKIGLDIKRGEQSILRQKTTYQQKYIFLKNKRSFNEMKYPRRGAHR